MPSLAVSGAVRAAAESLRAQRHQQKREVSAVFAGKRLVAVRLCVIHGGEKSLRRERLERMAGGYSAAVGVCAGSLPQGIVL